MSKKYDDDFFDELDKTTDLLKAFKPHIDTETNLNNLDDIYTELNINTNKSKKVDSREVMTKNFGQKTDIEKKHIALEKEKTKEAQPQLLNSTKDNKNSTQSQLSVEKNDILKSLVDDKKEKKEIAKSKEQTDINEIVDKINATVEESKKRTAKKKKAQKLKKEKAKFSKFELIFCSISFLFIIGCLGVYATRFMKYYRVYNPKSESGKSLMLLTTAIGKNSTLVYEGDGLYISGGEYIYKGKEVNNYIVFSNLTWRIIKTNTDGTIDLVLDDYINTLSWANRAKNYLESDVHKYLNEYFIKYLDKDYLEKTIICKDEVSDIKKFSCENKNDENYVRLLSVNEFLNSKTETTYISDEGDSLWLNTISSDKTWQINGLSLSLADPTRLLGIKPVIKLKSSVALISGDGSKDNPYRITEQDNDIHLGDYVKLGNDIYVVYNTEDNVLDLALNNVLSGKLAYSTIGVNYDVNENNSLANYLNGKYLDSLSYKDSIVEKEWGTGVYANGYEDVYSTKVVAKVGLLNISDFKFNSELQNYFLLNGNGKNIFVYGNETVANNPAISQNIRPAIRINKTNPSGGDGTLDNPYIMEA